MSRSLILLLLLPAIARIAISEHCAVYVAAALRDLINERIKPDTPAFQLELARATHASESAMIGKRRRKRRKNGKERKRERQERRRNKNEASAETRL